MGFHNVKHLLKMIWTLTVSESFRKITFKIVERRQEKQIILKPAGTENINILQHYLNNFPFQ